jgi:hypothetical protein
MSQEATAFTYLHSRVGGTSVDTIEQNYCAKLQLNPDSEPGECGGLRQR